MLADRPLILTLAAFTLAGTWQYGIAHHDPSKQESKTAQRDGSTDDQPTQDDRDEEKKKQTIPSNGLTGVWHENGGKVHNVRPGHAALPQPMWRWPAPPRGASPAPCVEAVVLAMASPQPQPVQPHAPPATG